MRLLILGGDGMLGHQLLSSLRARHEIKVTLRLSRDAYSAFPVFSAHNARFGVDVRDTSLLRGIIETERPDAVINAVGIVKQRPDSKDVIPSLEINSLLPHRLSQICTPIGIRLVHFSTDCVFSGSKGQYKESDVPDAIDLYGRTKLLGEITDNGAITLRTSIIGLELKRKTGLLEWFLAQRDPIRGFTRAIFTGFTTLELARIVELILCHPSSSDGMHHVSSEPISKYSLLLKIRDRLGSSLDIAPYDDFMCDRSLDSTPFRTYYSYVPPTWDSMIDELCQQILGTRQNDS